MCPKLQERGMLQGEYKYEMYHRAHPTKKSLELCIEDWDKYQTRWKAEGSTKEYVPYPYNIDMIAEYFQDYNKAVGMQCGVDGPSKSLGEAELDNLTYAAYMEKKKEGSGET